MFVKHIAVRQSQALKTQKNLRNKKSSSYPVFPQLFLASVTTKFIRRTMNEIHLPGELSPPDPLPSVSDNLNLLFNRIKFSRFRRLLSCASNSNSLNAAFSTFFADEFAILAFNNSKENSHNSSHISIFSCGVKRTLC